MGSLNSVNFSDLIANESFVAYCLGTDQLAINKWEKFIEKNPQLAPKIAEIKREVALVHGILPAQLVNNRLENFKRLFFERQRLKRQRIIFFKRTLRVLSAACILLVASFFYFYHKPQVSAIYSYSTIKGKKIGPFVNRRSDILLADGTTVSLYRGSTITIADDYNTADRKIVLNGQAFFSVAHNAAKPFTVFSENLKTRALGTSFLVRDFSSSNPTVLLLQGKVKINQPYSNTSDYLDQGNGLILNRKTKTTSKTTVNINELNQICFSELKFDNASTEEIVSKVEQFYGVEIQLNSVHLKKITGDYSEQSLDQIIASIAYINHITWKVEKNKITFEPIN